MFKPTAILQKLIINYILLLSFIMIYWICCAGQKLIEL